MLLDFTIHSALPMRPVGCLARGQPGEISSNQPKVAGRLTTAQPDAFDVCMGRECIAAGALCCARLNWPGWLIGAALLLGKTTQAGVSELLQ